MPTAISQFQLSNLTVLVTRPAHQADPFCQLVADHGGKTNRFPTLAIEPSESFQYAAELLSRTDQYDLVIFTSPNAVEYALPSLNPSTHPQWLAIGPKTAAALQQLPQIAANHPANSFNSEAALAIDSLQSVAGMRILIVKGEGGRTLLQDTLKARGAELECAEVYRRTTPQDWTPAQARDALHQSQIATATSVGIIENLYTMLSPLDEQTLLDLPVLAGGTRIAKAVSNLGFTNPAIVADNPSDEAMLQCLLQWVRS